MTLRALVTVLALAATATATTATATAGPVQLPDVLGGKLERVSARTGVPILLPDALDLGYDGRVFVTSTAARRSWSFSFAGARSCRGATACFLGTLSARRGGRPDHRIRVRLRGGVRGWFKPLSCGGSCSPPVLQFRRDGVLYSLAAKASRRELVRAAGEALRNGPIDPTVLLATGQSAPVGDVLARAGVTAAGRLNVSIVGPDGRVVAETTRDVHGLLSSLRRTKVKVGLQADGTGFALAIGPRNAREPDSVLTEFTWTAGPTPSIAIVAQ